MWYRTILIAGIWSTLACQIVTAAYPPLGEKKKSTATDLYGDPLPEGAIARLGSVRFRHGSDHIQSIAFSPDGQRIMSAGYDNVIRLWDSADGRPIAAFPHTMFDPIAYAADGKSLIVGPSNGKLSFLDIATGKLGKSILIGYSCHCFAITSDAKLAVTCSKSEVEQWIDVHHWDVATGKKQSTSKVPNVKGQYAIAPTPDDVTRMVVFGSDGNIVKSWSADTGQSLVEFRGHTAPVSIVAVSPNGKTLATIAGDQTIRFWNTATGKQLHAMESDSVISRIAFSPDGNTFGYQVRNSAKWDDDGTAHICDVPTGKVRHQVKLRSAVSFAFSPDGNTLAAVEGCSVHIWNLATGKEQMLRPGHIRAANSIAFSAEGSTLASGGADGSVLLWRNLDAAKPEMLAHDLKDVYSVAFAPGRSLLAASGEVGVRLWDPKTRKLMSEKAETYRTGQAQFFPDGKSILIAGDWQLAWLWYIDTDKVQRFNEGQIFRFTRATYESAALSPDGKMLVGTSQHGAGTVYDPKTGKTISRVSIDDEGFGSSSMRFAPDSKTLVLPDQAFWNKNGEVRFFDVSSSTVVRSSPKLKDFSATAFAFSPDGHTVAVGGYDGSIIFLEFATGGKRLGFGRHLGKINDLAFSPDGRILATASDDGTILIWQLDRLPGLKTAAGPLSTQQIVASWNDLGSADASVAYQAIVRLCQDGKRSAPVLVEQLRSLWKHDAKQVHQLILEMESGSFAVRAKAMKELEELQDTAASALQNGLRGNPSAESVRRIESLLKRLTPPTPTSRQVRVLRAMEVLEQGATDIGISWLKQLAHSATGTLLTREASLALDRITKSGKRVP